MSPYECAADLLDVRNLPPRQVEAVTTLLSHHQPGGSVYAIYQGSTSLVKLGRSEDVPRRLTTLTRQHDASLTLLASAYCPCSVAAVEGWLHEHFQPMRVSGEWFSCEYEFFAKPGVFASLVQDVHYAILQHTWRELIVQKLVGSWVLDKERVRAFLSG